MLNYWSTNRVEYVGKDDKHIIYVCRLEEFILVDVVTLLYKMEVIWNGTYTGLYTNV